MTIYINCFILFQIATKFYLKFCSVKHFGDSITGKRTPEKQFQRRSVMSMVRLNGEIVTNHSSRYELNKHDYFMSTSFFEQAVARHGNGNVSAAESLYRKAIENNEQRNSASFNLTLYIRQIGRASCRERV